MPDFYFHGSLVQYWKVIYAEYLRLFSAYGREPFEFISPNPKTSPLAEYIPDYYDLVEIIFWEAEHRDFLVRVKADSALDSDLVNLYISIYITPLKQYGEANLSTWKAVENSLEKQGLLIRPTAQYQVKKKPKMQEEKKRKLEQLREFRLKRIKETGQAPTKAYAMSEVGISYATCKTHDPQLLKNWKDKDYE